MMSFIRHVAALVLVFLAPTAMAVTEIDKVMCPNANIWGKTLFNNICWSQLYPIRLAGIDLFGDIGPADSNRRSVCACGGNVSKGELPMIGFSLGHWRPVRIVEAVRKPWCLPSMGGIKMANTATRGDVNLTGGVIDHSNGGEKMGFYNINYYFADFMAMFNMLSAPKCNPGGMVDFDLAQTSAFYPQWSKDKLAAVLNPEVSLLASIGLPLLQPADCLATTATGKSVDEAFLTAGCWGAMVPYTGVVRPATSGPEMWLLTSTRFLGMLSRLGMLTQTVGSGALCGSQPMPILKKSQYMLQMLYPVPQSNNGNNSAAAPASDSTNNGTQVPELDLADLSDRCTTTIGESTLKSMEFRMRPATGEDAVFLLWQWVDCCIGMTP